jgi:hypothetical protein
VLLYALYALAYKRRKIKKYATAEACQRIEQERKDLDDIRRSDIPFGARALERGVQVQGIWIANQKIPFPSPYQPGTPVESQPCNPTLRPFSQLPTTAVMAQVQKPSPTCSSMDLPQCCSSSHVHPAITVYQQPYYASQDVVSSEERAIRQA